MENIEEEQQELNQESELSASEKYYQNHLDRMRRYNRKNKEIINQRNRDRFKKMLEDPEKREQYLQRKREEYKKMVSNEERYSRYLEKKRQAYKLKKQQKQSQNEE